MSKTNIQRVLGSILRNMHSAHKRGGGKQARTYQSGGRLLYTPAKTFDTVLTRSRMRWALEDVYVNYCCTPAVAPSATFARRELP